MIDRLDWNPTSDAAQRASRIIALGLLDTLVDKSDRIRKRDAESVHAFRTELRKLRAWLNVYRPCLSDTVGSRIHRRLRDLATATRQLRDIDVQIAWLRAERRALGTERLMAARWVIASLKTERKRAWKRFRKARARQFSRLESDLRDALSHYVIRREIWASESVTTMHSATAQLLALEAANLAGVLARIRSADDTRRLHRGRIAARRVRYVLEALGAHSPAMPGVVDDLGRFQDVVGELRDAQLLAHRVSREVTTVVSERTALVASELVYRPVAGMDFSRVMNESPFDASLALLFARLHDRIAVAARAVSSALNENVARNWIRELTARPTTAPPTDDPWNWPSDLR